MACVLSGVFLSQESLPGKPRPAVARPAARRPRAPAPQTTSGGAKQAAAAQPRRSLNVGGARSPAPSNTVARSLHSPRSATSSVQTSPRGLQGWSQKWGGASPSATAYPRSPCSRSIDAPKTAIPSSARPRAVSPELPERKFSSGGVRPGAAQAKQTSYAVDQALRAVQQALEKASSACSERKAASARGLGSLRGYSFDDVALFAAPGESKIPKLNLPQRQRTGGSVAASIRGTSPTTKMALARQTQKEKLHAVERSQSFELDILDKLDDLRDVLASCSTSAGTVTSCSSPRESLI